ncbi:MAG TPA: hypothetical protein VH559_14585 [Gemmatimonadaceae bacterium]
MLLIVAAFVAVRSVAGQRGAALPIKAGVIVAPDTVQVGDPFRVTVGVSAPRGATIEFPRATDSASAVQSLDPVVVRTGADTTGVEQSADYRVAAWDVGRIAIRLPDVVVRYNGVERHVPLSAEVFVASVLPADTALRVAKPPRPLFEINPFPWWILAAALAAAIIIGLLIWWLFRRRKKTPAVVTIDAFTRAQAEFQRIEALRLLDAGERGRYVTLMIEVLRDYLAARYVEAALSLTSTELHRSLSAAPYVPDDRLARLLNDADLIKFARRPVSGDRARDLGREARAIVADEHRASQPAPERVAA